MKVFKRSIDNKEITTIHTSAYKISLINIGAAIFRLSTPDKDGKWEEIVISKHVPKDYLDNIDYFGTNVGRIAGRIANSKFSIDDKEYKVPNNEPKHNLHSSGKGISFMESKPVIDNKGETIVVSYNFFLEEVNDGFPGNMDITIQYTFSEDSFRVTFIGSSDQDTLFNMTNHSYFNLSGNLKRDILDQRLENTFDHIYDLEDDVPSVKLPAKEAFQYGDSIKDLLINNCFIQSRGFNNPFGLKDHKIVMSDDMSGRELTVTTSYDYAMLWSNNIPTSVLGNKTHYGLAIECQYLPNDININENSRTILRKGKQSQEYVEYSFKTNK